ncbi:glycogen debranching protein GlgX [Pseudohalioglobus lutimaris]|uniref:Glycogen debranching enzyme GlgX n=1 Tax=Pseudohalioglobus lutimaris TaxID=1737061 RepID=A0A2N5X5A7_9GAMM|nr:glycogen debranching protein GlgX [Pseudohalioglobus lutimaris]PLW69670.1 glycogen debranching enzyme GlgX [Pseudohalioglobus lutimaris]
MIISSGISYPLGATCQEGGTNFAIFSAHAERVELCLYDSEGVREIARLTLPEKTHDIWHGFVEGATPGLCYGYRIHGAYDPHEGHRFNANKLLLDPYARALKGRFEWHSSHLDYDVQEGPVQRDSLPNAIDNQAYMPKAVVVVDSVPAATGCNPAVPWHETVIYEAHVKGFTRLHPDVPDALRGTFAGFSHPKIIEYIKSLGVTCVELLPVHAFTDEYHLSLKGLTNYWGYNTLSFFALHSDYLGGSDPLLFRNMVDRFHDAGLEVILDVVYNHSCEGNHLGPTLSFKGIDNHSYYQLVPGDNYYYINDTGCGNTLNIRHPRVLQLVMDSLRYWVTAMGVDGFRFDLAVALGREEHGFNTRSAFFQAISQDPVLSRVKLIAEPWDVGPGGYQLGNFPAGWSEWNDRYRDTVRRFWRGDEGLLPELARRLHGSGDLFEHAGRKPSASINFVTSHDGFSLRDLVSYSSRHNHGNLEDNNDGHRENYSSNHGFEGETDHPKIKALRWRQQRNILTTLLVSQGVPMLQAGDELGRTQSGNNNAYCQDNSLNWVDWENVTKGGESLIALVRKLIAIRRSFPVFLATVYRHRSDDSRDDSIHWLNSDGKTMRQEHWHERDTRVLGYLLSERSEYETDDSRQLLVIFNAADESQHFSLPQTVPSEWQVIIDTAKEESTDLYWTGMAAKQLTLAPRSVVVMTTARAGGPHWLELAESINSRETL